MTVNRFVKGEPSATKVERIEVTTKRATHCEITGCKTLYVGRDASGKERCARGKADVLVKDHRGDLRGICATHYTRELVRQGKAANQDLVDEGGRMMKEKIEAFHANNQPALVTQPARYGAPKDPQQFTVPAAVVRQLSAGDEFVSDDEFFASHERDRDFA